ncbi:hypothetical protein VP01_3903g1 [Puccinia sorghi]|uniref:Uncharacterized protein n=1 Tax=Puccinia sorghi TaxID=27349 RepID=A0A0L6USN7_9BASI|nr:hypothetical protein VP01_3903g1 [Puccinia sorghi]
MVFIFILPRNLGDAFENRISDTQQTAHAKNLLCHSRLTNLQNTRVAVLSQYPKLFGLVPIFKACCNNENTENEASQYIQVSYSKHHRIKEMMESIDELKWCGKKSNPRGSAGAEPWSHRCIPSPKKNQKNPPTKLEKESQMKPPAKLKKVNGWHLVVHTKWLL